MTLDQVDMDVKRGARIAQSNESDNNVTTSDQFTNTADISWVEEATFLFKNTTDRSVEERPTARGPPRLYR